MAEPAAALEADPTLGDLLRYWRRVRSMSQLDLASAATTTPRHMSFVETGRSRPSREMVLRLAGALDVPLRDRNGLLLAAGYAPLYVERALDDPALDRVNAAISGMLAQHEPLPARADVTALSPGEQLDRSEDTNLHTGPPSPSRSCLADGAGARAEPLTPSGR